MSWISTTPLSWFQFCAVKILKTGQIPQHVAIIMDGNRRYANERKIPKRDGHSKGFDKLAETLQWCMDLGIPEVTVYAFSIENFKRTQDEVNDLMSLARNKFQRLLDESDELMKHGICVRVIGNLSLIPKDMQQLIAKAMFMTRHNNKAFLNVAFAYTSRDEITHTVKDILKGIKDSEILPEDITENLISECLYTYQSPEPDLLIRTSGEVRLSDFLVWQTSDACIYFSDVLWPDFNLWAFLKAIFYYQRCYPDIQKRVKMKTIKSTINNHRVTKFLQNLHHKRQIMIEELSNLNN